MTNTHRLFVVTVILAGGISAAPGCTFFSFQCAPECHYTSFGVCSGAPEPKSPSKTIRMEAQEVIMRLKKHSYTVDAVFRFFNTGDTTKEWIGFPVRGNACRDGRLVAPAFIRFNCWIDGRKLELRKSRDLIRDTKNLFYTLYYSRSRAAPCDETYYRWLSAYPTFPGRARTTVRISYEMDYVYGGEMPPVQKAIYILGTASHWQGSIGNFTLTVDRSRVASHSRMRRNPPPSLATQDVLRSVVKDFTPFPRQEIQAVILP